MRRLLGAAALSAAGLIMLSACTPAGLNVGNAKHVRQEVTAAADELDSSVIAKLVLYRGAKGAGSATLSVIDADGAVKTTAIDDASATGIESTAISGVALADVPFEDLSRAVKDAAPHCPENGAAASITTTRTGRQLIESYCIGRTLADEVRQSQTLGGEQLPELDSLVSAEALRTILSEARAVVGDDATAFSITPQPVGDFDPIVDIEAPQADGVDEPCTTSYVRTPTALRYSPACGTFVPPADANLVLSELDADAIAAAIAEAAGGEEPMSVTVDRDEHDALQVTVATAAGAKTIAL